MASSGYKLDMRCATDGCDGTPFFGETASPGRCDSCHVARIEAENRAAVEALEEAHDWLLEQSHATRCPAGHLCDGWSGCVKGAVTVNTPYGPYLTRLAYCYRGYGRAEVHVYAIDRPQYAEATVYVDGNLIEQVA